MIKRRHISKKQQVFSEKIKRQAISQYTERTPVCYTHPFNCNTHKEYSPSIYRIGQNRTPLVYADCKRTLKPRWGCRNKIKMNTPPARTDTNKAGHSKRINSLSVYSLSQIDWWMGTLGLLWTASRKRTLMWTGTLIYSELTHTDFLGYISRPAF